ncbi:hypothetical protein N7541_001700 [Penicillium brevicompactum]|uniref:ER-bound oxygenase mpaB/mpaB'/Rubber oxygenase catalytic domain-containing protein n=1 Tax=Penicillium brevicompactum TaxID=5074 RepID=A0A9W9QBE7_PENBR|nr:uncharacterized protein N7506_000641 [Penicillium brevicompactum]KAJ5328162.1 hypothetical protein N7452_008552 [Penicillium brevicompactum]KAJ5347388.1 hypothetical protein N7506_000641 [Penicillium brevicompactum]KAJ5367759.1 hypothetical protein N7541_001700 [Penicillium brevicompactum]
MSSTSSPVSPVDEKNVEALPTSISDATQSTSDSGRLHALEQLEIFPKMLQEGIIFAGAGAALLLQAALPGIRDGATGGHKELATELIDTLQAHISYISCLVFGTRAERKTLLDLLHNGDRPLLGDGHATRFAAHPSKQLWMAATLYATSTDFYQRIYGRVDYASAQRAYSEFTLLMNCLGVPAGTWPASRQEFWSYWDDQVSQLTVSEDAAQFAKDLRESTEMPRWVQSMKPFLRVATIEMLPPRLRDAYGLKSTVGTRALYRTYMGFSVALYPAFPDKWRAYPYKFYQDRLKEKLNVV